MGKVYIAGKITGNENFIKDFADAENKLTNAGFTVMNPAVLPHGFKQEEYLHICMAMIDVCDMTVFLPNWVDSNGAKFEMEYSKAMNKRITYFDRESMEG